MVYVLFMEGVVTIPSTMIQLNTTEFQDSITFNSIHGQPFTVLNIDPVVAYRVTYSTAVYLDRPVITSDVSDVQNRLQSIWSSRLSGNVTVSIELQEPVVTDNG